MCGIVGIAGAKVGAKADREWLVRARDSLRHRGPDDAGAWWTDDGRVGLGHRRLAIIDLSQAGHQPMTQANGGLAIVFNGEIYNFRDLQAELARAGHAFHSQSDTEVLLVAYREWGTECVRHLVGQFAFAIFDASRGHVFMARDRAGEKPLYYAVRNGVLRFGSELKALLADPDQPRRINPAGLDCYLTLGFAPGELCMVEGIRKLPPAHAMVFEVTTGVTRSWRYWQLPAPAVDAGDEVALLDELEALLARAVSRQLVADVPVGVLLSGGVDSSVVTALAARAQPRVKTFTIRFSRDRKYDETAHARLVARHFATDHVELDAAEPTADLLPLLARQFDEPIVDSSMIPTYLVSKLTREQCTVALGGDGGDELFGGYRQYNRLIAMREWSRWLPRVAARAIARGAEIAMPIGMRGRIRLQSFGADLRSGLALTAYCFDRDTRQSLLARYGRWSPVAETIWDRRVPASADIVDRATRMDFTNYLPEDVLVKVDRASMLCSLEVRAPLLDHTLVEFAFGRVPTRLKATRGGRKILFKRLAARILPQGFDAHRKQGFAAPLPSWLKLASWSALFHDVLADPDAIVAPEVSARLLASQARGRMNSERLFALVMLELWRREYRLTL